MQKAQKKQDKIELVSKILNGKPEEGIGALYIGTIDSAVDVPSLKENKITHVLSLIQGYDTSVMKNTLKEHKISHKLVEVTDQPDSKIEDHLDECCIFIKEALENGNC